MIDFIKFLLGAAICMGGCIGLMKWIDTWEVEEKEVKKEVEEEIKGDVKKEATPKIQEVLNLRKLSIEKRTQEEMVVKKRSEMMARYPFLSPAQIEQELKFEECFDKYLSVGVRDDYFNFLNAYVESGGIPNQHRDYWVEYNKEIYIAKNKIEIFPLYGSRVKKIIIMPGCEIIDGNPGRNNFYCYDDILNQKYAYYIPTYKDWEERWN